MRKWIGVSVISAAAVTCGGIWARAQVVQPNNPRIAPNVAQQPPQIISGADFGFRVDSWGPDGRPTWRLVVHQKGEWVEVALAGGVRRLTAN